MKKIYKILLILFIGLFCNCEEVIDVNLKTKEPKLVIEANINWQKGTIGNIQKIKLSTTTGYFSDSFPTVSGALILIKNSLNQTFNFTETPNTGEYICTNFEPKINETYTLSIVLNNDTYTAIETLKSVAPIDELVQNNEGGFTGKDIEIKTYYTDPINENNFYLYQFNYSNQITPNFYADEDTYFQGNRFFSISQNDNLKKGDQITITHYGISQAYYNYMNILLSVAGSTNGGPFQSPPATVRGNIINTTNKANFPLGYFSLSEIDAKTYTVE